MARPRTDGRTRVYEIKKTFIRTKNTIPAKTPPPSVRFRRTDVDRVTFENSLAPSKASGRVVGYFFVSRKPPINSAHAHEFSSWFIVRVFRNHPGTNNGYARVANRTCNYGRWRYAIVRYSKRCAVRPARSAIVFAAFTRGTFSRVHSIRARRFRT